MNLGGVSPIHPAASRLYPAYKYQPLYGLARVGYPPHEPGRTPKDVVDLYSLKTYYHNRKAGRDSITFGDVGGRRSGSVGKDS